MITYVLNIKPSTRPVSETKLTKFGVWMDGFNPDEIAHEMCVQVYQDFENWFPISSVRTIVIGEEYHREILEKYSLNALLGGVKIESLLSVVNSISLDKELLFEEEVRRISNEIMEAKEFADSDLDFLRIIQREIFKLKEKFKIYPK